MITEAVRLAPGVMLALAIAGCATPAAKPAETLATPSEREMFVTLKEIKATDKQRLAVMDAWDDSHARLVSLEEEAQRIREDWFDLSRREPAFVKKSSALARRQGEILQERLQLTGKFEAKVASILTEDQWQQWQRRAMREHEAGPRKGATRRP